MREKIQIRFALQLGALRYIFTIGKLNFTAL